MPRGMSRAGWQARRQGSVGAGQRLPSPRGPIHKTRRHCLAWQPRTPNCKLIREFASHLHGNHFRTLNRETHPPHIVTHSSAPTGEEGACLWLPLPQPIPCPIGSEEGWQSTHQSGPYLCPRCAGPAPVGPKKEAQPSHLPPGLAVPREGRGRSAVCPSSWSYLPGLGLVGEAVHARPHVGSLLQAVPPPPHPWPQRTSPL